MPRVAGQWLRDILNALYLHRTLTRAQIIEFTRLNSASVSLALQHLLQRGVILKAGEVQSDGGRKRDLLKLNEDAAYFVAIDLEGTRARFGLSSFVGDMRYRWEEDIAFGKTLEVGKLRRGVGTVLQSLRPAQREKVVAVGVSYPGMMDAEGRLTAVNLGWHKFPLHDALRMAVDLPSFALPDGHICVEAESSLGRARHCDNWMFVIVENGAGLGLCVNGTTLKGVGGELGHCTVDPEAEDLCNCGKRGCLEAIVASPNIVRQYLEKTSRPAADPERLRVTDVFERARRNDEAARQVVNRAGRVLGLALSHAVNLLAPEMVILGGDLIAGQDLLEPALREELARHALPDLLARLELTVSGLGLDIRLKGAASLAFREAVSDPLLLEKILDASCLKEQAVPALAPI